MRAELLPSSHYYLGSLSLDLQGPSRGSQRLSWQRGGGPQGILPDPRGSSLGPLSLPRESSENLEKVPRIWEVEGPGGPR